MWEVLTRMSFNFASEAQTLNPEGPHPRSEGKECIHWDSTHPLGRTETGWQGTTALVLGLTSKNDLVTQRLSWMIFLKTVSCDTNVSVMGQAHDRYGRLWACDFFPWQCWSHPDIPGGMRACHHRMLLLLDYLSPAGLVLPCCPLDCGSLPSPPWMPSCIFL